MGGDGSEAVDCASLWRVAGGGCARCKWKSYHAFGLAWRQDVVGFVQRKVVMYKVVCTDSGVCTYLTCK